jgi:hypothetical protein
MQYIFDKRFASLAKIAIYIGKLFFSFFEIAQKQDVFN